MYNWTNSACQTAQKHKENVCVSRIVIYAAHGCFREAPDPANVTRNTAIQTKHGTRRTGLLFKEQTVEWI